MTTPERYENHAEEWKEEEAQRRLDEKYVPYVDPRSPEYIGKEDEENGQV